MRSSGSPPDLYDVAVVGGGVVGTAVARRLSRHRLDCVLLEAGPDVGAGTSKANTAILHTGFDAKPGTLEAALVRRGRDLLLEEGPGLGIPIEQTGALLVAWSEAEVAALPGIVARARQNGWSDVRPVDRAELYRREPNLGQGPWPGWRSPARASSAPSRPARLRHRGAGRRGRAAARQRGRGCPPSSAACCSAPRAPGRRGAAHQPARGVAAGNLVHAAETADVAALGGRHAAGAVLDFLATGTWPEKTVELACAPPLRWVAPNRLAAAAGGHRRALGRLLLRADAFGPARQDGRVLWSGGRRLVPNRSIRIPTGWLYRADPAGGPVTLATGGGPPRSRLHLDSGGEP